MAETNASSSNPVTQCQFCNNETPTEYNFCVFCDNQIKCIACSSKIYPGKSYCLKCVTPLAKKPVSTENTNHYIRKVEQQGDNYSEHIEFTVSNEAVKEIAPFVIGQTMQGSKYIPKAKPVLPNTSQVDFIEEDNGSERSEVTEANNEVNNNPNFNLNNQQSPTTSISSQFFTKDGDYLIPKKTDFKGETWADQQRHFLTLYIHAYKEIFNKPIPSKEHLKDVANKIKVSDPNNFPSILSKFINSKVLTLSSGLELNDEGEKELKLIAALMKDENGKAGFSYLNRPTSNGSKTARLSKETKTKLDSWLTADVDLGKLDIRLVITGRDAFILSLWIITKYLKKAEAILWNEAAYYLSSKFKEIGVSSEAIKKALIFKDNQTLFQKNTAGEYLLSPTGENTVESWVSGSAEIKSKKEI